MDVREFSAALLGNKYRLEVLAAVAQSSSPLVYAKGLADDLHIKDSEVSATLRRLAGLGMLIEHGRVAGGRERLYFERMPSMLWEHFTTLFSEFDDDQLALEV